MDLEKETSVESLVLGLRRINNICLVFFINVNPLLPIQISIGLLVIFPSYVTVF